MAHAFTCVTCLLAFSDASLQRIHYATDFHRYNSKRRVAGLPAITDEVFDAKVASKLGSLEPIRSGKERCGVCSKVFNSANAFADHLRSKRHRDTLANPPEASTTGPIRMSQTAAPHIARLNCLFCSKILETFEDKLQHMHTQHGFFVPDAEYLVDLEGVIEQATKLVADANLCLYCGAGFAPTTQASEDEFPSTAWRMQNQAIEAVRKHMLDKGHCKLPWDTEEERLRWSDFYDYSASHLDGAEDEDSWEDVDDSVTSATGGDASVAKPSLRYGDSIYELILPSGSRIGHRALRHVYQQNLVPYMNDAPTARTATSLVGTQSRQGQSPPSKELVRDRGNHVVKAKSAGDAKFAERAVRQHLSSRAKELQRTRVALTSGNSQKHFRDPLLQ